VARKLRCKWPRAGCRARKPSRHRDINRRTSRLRKDGYVKVLDLRDCQTDEKRMASDEHTGETTAGCTRAGVGVGRALNVPETGPWQKVDASSGYWRGRSALRNRDRKPAVPRRNGPSDCIASILTTEPQSLGGVLPDVPLKHRTFAKGFAKGKKHDERYRTINEMLDLVFSRAKMEVDGSLPQTKARAALSSAKSKP